MATGYLRSNAFRRLKSKIAKKVYIFAVLSGKARYDKMVTNADFGSLGQRFRSFLSFRLYKVAKCRTKYFTSLGINCRIHQQKCLIGQYFTKLQQKNSCVILQSECLSIVLSSYIRRFTPGTH